MQLRYTALIRHGQLHIDRSQFLRSEVVETYEDGPLLVTIEPLPPGPTTQMHRYYRGVVLPGVIDALNDLGNAVANTPATHRIVHTELKAALLPDAPDVLCPVSGEVTRPENSTAGLPRPVFGRYIAAVCEAVLELTGWEIPPPPTDWDS